MPTFEDRLARRNDATRTHELSDDQLVGLCLTYGIRLDVPLSQLDADAIWRGIDLGTVLKCYLIARMEEVGVTV